MPKHGHLLRASQSSLHLKDSQFKAKSFVNTSASVLALTVLALVAFKIAAAPQMTNESNSKSINCDIQNISHCSYEYIFWNVIISVKNSC
ncbi:hypothetical protein F8M41_005011 [Gigaspora margarita]|uniref:Uncharacterized protein n=1 Tax=Gigaspora margarita TaxID=4874 RepID=A0A8H3XBT2_GIGMA|nr:hypothetical protein F8M41_005011 [Gigaspora margarita]